MSLNTSSAAEEEEPTAFSSDTTAETAQPHLEMNFIIYWLFLQSLNLKLQNTNYAETNLEVEALELVQIEVLEKKGVDKKKGCKKGLVLLLVE